jgi:hypothetical protein
MTDKNGNPLPKPDPAGGSEPICDRPYNIDNNFDQNDPLDPLYRCIKDPNMQDNKGLLGAALNEIPLGGGKSRKKNTRRRRRKTTHRHHRKSQRKRQRLR